MQISLHPRLLWQMNRCEITIYYLLADMITRQARKSPRGAMYAWPSQGWIAKQLKYSRGHVNKCLKHMHEIGVFLKRHRRQVGGRWRSCLYQFGWLFWKLAGRTREAIKALLDRVKYDFHIFKPIDIKKKPNPIINQEPIEQTLKIEENLTRVREFLKTLA